MRSVRSLKNLNGKTVLVRVDFNVENFSDALRFRRIVPTIKLLRRKGAVVVLVSHRGRPRGFDRKLSLRSALPFLKKHFGTAGFFPDFDFTAIRKRLSNAKPGSVFLLENVRFHPGEQACDRAFAHQLASLGQVYVNEAFAVSHREGTTITVLPKLLPAYAGLLLEAEVVNLTRTIKRPKKPFIAILAGGKAQDKFAVIKYLHPRVTTFYVGGVLANTFLRARGIPVAKKLFDASLLPQVRRFIDDPKVVAPTDWIDAGRMRILDIGPFSASQIAHAVKRAKTVVWNGPLGLFEDKRFRSGSVTVAQALAHSRAFTVVGGGETTELITMLKLEKRIKFLSTGGGAMLSFLAGKKLPGLIALEDAKT